MDCDLDDFDYVIDCVGYDLCYVIDLFMFYDELCWVLKYIDFEEGLWIMIDWYCDNELWWCLLKDVMEVCY